MKIKTKDIMTKKVIFATPDIKIEKIAKLLFDNRLSGMPVVDAEKKIMGIITEADLISKDTKIHIPSYIQFLEKIACAKKEKNDKMKEQCEKIIDIRARDVMTENIICVNPETSLEELVDIFIKKRINPIPVTENNKLVGIVSRADLIKLLK